MQLAEKKSHSVNRGMFDVRRRSRRDQRPRGRSSGVRLIDHRMRPKNPVIFQEEYDLSKHLPPEDRRAGHR
jgi:hypothetical protein